MTIFGFSYGLVRQRKPTTVLEFGSGCSTLVMTLGLAHNAREGGRAGRLYSVDAVEFWANATQKALPHDLRTICETLYARALETVRDSVSGWVHAAVPDIAPDFVYLDGPPLEEGRAVAFDLLDLEPRFGRRFALVVDGRSENVAFLHRHFARRYRLTDRPVSNNSFFELVG